MSGATDPTARRLGRLVATEARRAEQAAGPAPDSARTAAGWIRRSTVDAARATELMGLYAQLGYDVVADPARPEEFAQGCRACRVATAGLRTIYTRRHGGQESAR